MNKAASMSTSRIDLVYRRLIVTKFFSRGWGRPEDMQELMRLHKLLTNRRTAQTLVNPNHPVTVEQKVKTDSYTIFEGHFRTPLYDHAPQLAPNPVRTARFEIIVPSRLHLKEKKKHSAFFSTRHMKPACIHLAGTGDHGFSRRRRLMARPLLKHGIASVMLENPFYGSRKPKEQTFSGLLHVNDLFVMGCCVMLECSVIMHWLKQNGYGPLGLTGISLGGHLASLAATIWPEKVALVPCMSWTSASPVWSEGVLSSAIPWRVLEAQYSEDARFERDIVKLLTGVDLYREAKEAKAQKSIDPLKWMLKKHKSKGKSVKKVRTEQRQRNTLAFMKGLMDHVTHLANYTPPVDTAACTFVVAKQDGYFPRRGVTPVTDVWTGCQVREIDGGHVNGFLVSHSAFSTAIVDTFHRLVKDTQPDGNPGSTSSPRNHPLTDLVFSPVVS